MKTAIVAAMALVGVSSIPFHAQQSMGSGQMYLASSSVGNTAGAASSGVASTEGQLVHTVGAAGRALNSAAPKASNGPRATAPGAEAPAAHAKAVPGARSAGSAHGKPSPIHR